MNFAFSISFAPVALDVFEGAAGGFGDVAVHYIDVGDAHAGEEQEGAGGGERAQQPWG